MRKTTVKICGLTTQEDVQMCMDLRVDILGFVTEYPLPVPWNLNRRSAEKLLSLVKPPYRTCLVTGGAPAKVIELAEGLCPSMIQLHFMETLDDASQIARALKPLGISTIKTIPVSGEERIDQFGTSNIETIVKELCKTEIYGILVDSRAPANAAKTGIEIDTAFYMRVKSLASKPVILAGGITPGNVEEMIAQTNAEFIDVMTGVEKFPGNKDEMKLTGLLARL